VGFHTHSQVTMSPGNGLQMHVLSLLARQRVLT